ncbi:hypothetical protein [Longimicrobium sp.]|uniref:hypothetical protein n=1 Tax=Longimicrobium sp. TaxID=2029185 RepID=UPI002E2F03D8|nr:hypothetical protein [Longimicrobium sp.]HEX6038545.1 hypothetical protein [Longimicrobium sp.]
MPPSSRKILLASSLLLAAAPAATHAQRAPTVPMEVFGGRLQLADEIGGGDVDVAGVLAGIDVGAYAGLHGFYWRAVESDPVAAGNVQAFGGEGQVNLNVGNGFTPFLVGGVARLDFLEADEDGGETPDDRTMPIVGAGVRLDVGRFGLQGAVRSYVADADAGDEDGGSNWVHSPLWTVGAAFRLGRTGRAPRVAAAPPAASATRVVRGDTVYVVRGDTSYQSGNFVSIPIPREGEIYLRYGPGEGSRANGAQAAAPAVATPLDDAALENLRRRILDDMEPLLRGMLAEERAETVDMVRRELAAVSPSMTPDAEARLLDRIDALVALRVRDELTAARLLGDSAYAARPAPPAEERFVPRFGALRPYMGGNLDRPRQFVAGVRLDLGPFDAARPAIRLIPEAALGLGQGGASVMLAGNVAYEAGGMEVRGTPVRPYGYVGAGFLFINDPPVNRPGTEAVVNLGYGFSIPVPNRSHGELFLEHQGVDLFDLNRVLVGLRF